MYNIFTNSVEFSPIKDLTITGESLFVKTPFDFSNDFTEWSNGYAFTAKYELTEKVSLYSNYNYYQAQQLPNTPPIAWQLKHTTDVSVGVNYHQDNWQLAAEIHKIQGGRWSMPADYRADPDSYKNWYMVGVNFVYFF